MSILRFAMIIKDIEFVGSFEHEYQCPKEDIPEYAFIGRSNVGKSSLINAISGRKSIAKISSTPGKTQTINYFKVNNSWFLVDLPGYGYAKISKTQRRKWEKMINSYLRKRQNLFCIFSLIDSRHKLQKIDKEFLDKLADLNVPFVIVYTKIDKVKKSEQIGNIELINNELSQFWEPLPQHFVTSSESKVGIENLVKFIHQTNGFD